MTDKKDPPTVDEDWSDLFDDFEAKPAAPPPPPSRQETRRDMPAVGRRPPPPPPVAKTPDRPVPPPAPSNRGAAVARTETSYRFVATEPRSPSRKAFPSSPDASPTPPPAKLTLDLNEIDPGAGSATRDNAAADKAAAAKAADDKAAAEKAAAEKAAAEKAAAEKAAAEKAAAEKAAAEKAAEKAAAEKAAAEKAAAEKAAAEKAAAEKAAADKAAAAEARAAAEKAAAEKAAADKAAAEKAAADKAAADKAAAEERAAAEARAAAEKAAAEKAAADKAAADKAAAEKAAADKAAAAEERAAAEKAAAEERAAAEARAAAEKAAADKAAAAEERAAAEKAAAEERAAAEARAAAEKAAAERRPSRDADWLAQLNTPAPSDAASQESVERVRHASVVDDDRDSFSRERSFASSSGSSAASIEQNALREPVCAMWIGGTCFGLPVSIVGELAPIVSFTEVPLTARNVLGIFNLRGVPLPVIDLIGVLGFGESQPGTKALVVGEDGLRFAVPVERVEMLTTQRRVTLRDRGPTDHQAVDGFIELGDDRTVTLLSAAAVLAAIRSIRDVYEEA